MQPSSGHMSQSIFSLLERSKRIYLERFNKGSEGPYWYKCLLLLSVLFKNSRREAFQIEVQLLFQEGPPDSALLQSVTICETGPREGVREKAELPHMVFSLPAQGMG